MTKTEANNLDRKFQETVLKMHKHQSVLGGKADVVHHHKQGRYNAIRWYKPCGVPLLHCQHDEVHRGTPKGQSFQKYYILEMEKIWGDDWEVLLERRKHQAVKVDYQKVLNYLDNNIDDYI